MLGWNVLFQHTECEKKKPFQLHTVCGFCLYSVSVISLKSKSKLCQCETQTKSMLFQDNGTTRENSFYSTRPPLPLNFSDSLSFSNIQ